MNWFSGDGRRPKGSAENYIDEGVPEGVQDRVRAKDASAALVEVTDHKQLELRFSVKPLLIFRQHFVDDSDHYSVQGSVQQFQLPSQFHFSVSI